MGPVLSLLCVVLKVCIFHFVFYFHKSADLCLRLCCLIFMLEHNTMYSSAFMSSLFNLRNVAIIYLTITCDTCHVLPLNEQFLLDSQCVMGVCFVTLSLLCVVLRVCVFEYAFYFHKSVNLCLWPCCLIFIMEYTTIYNSAFMSSLFNLCNAAII